MICATSGCDNQNAPYDKFCNPCRNDVNQYEKERSVESQFKVGSKVRLKSGCSQRNNGVVTQLGYNSHYGYHYVVVDWQNQVGFTGGSYEATELELIDEGTTGQ